VFAPALLRAMPAAWKTEPTCPVTWILVVMRFPSFSMLAGKYSAKWSGRLPDRLFLTVHALGLRACHIPLPGPAAARPARAPIQRESPSHDKKILAGSGLRIVAADDLGDAAKKIVAEVKQAA